MRKLHLALGSLALVGILSIAGLAGAHAHRDRFTPDVNKVITVAPQLLDLSFTQGLKQIEVQVFSANGDSVTAGTAEIDPANVKRATVPLQANLPVGSYTVAWHVLAEDGHTSSGRYQFHVTEAGQQGQVRVFLNGKEIQGDVPAQIIDGRTMVPVRAVAEAIGKLVEWDAEQQFVIISDRPAGHGHHTQFQHPEGTEAPSAKLQISPDPKAGFNIQVETAHWTWAPERSNSEALPNEGHGHLYVNGVKVARLYGPWYHLEGLTPGQHEIKVTLNAHDHADYVVGHTVVGASATVIVRQDGTRVVGESSHADEHHGH